jgi:hypothetical protein
MPFILANTAAPSEPPSEAEPRLRWWAPVEERAHTDWSIIADTDVLRFPAKRLKLALSAEDLAAQLGLAAPRAGLASYGVSHAGTRWERLMAFKVPCVEDPAVGCRLNPEGVLSHKATDVPGFVRDYGGGMYWYRPAFEVETERLKAAVAREKALKRRLQRGDVPERFLVTLKKLLFQVDGKPMLQQEPWRFLSANLWHRDFRSRANMIRTLPGLATLAAQLRTTNYRDAAWAEAIRAFEPCLPGLRKKAKADPSVRAFLRWLAKERRALKAEGL